jgi:hypothetical protein
MSTHASHIQFGAEGGSRTLRKVCYRAFPGSAMCVQNLDDSRGFAIRITYRISLRSSSLWEPRHPLLKVVIHLLCKNQRKPTNPSQSENKVTHYMLHLGWDAIRTVYTFASRSSISARVHMERRLIHTERAPHTTHTPIHHRLR